MCTVLEVHKHEARGRCRAAYTTGYTINILFCIANQLAVV